MSMSGTECASEYANPAEESSTRKEGNVTEKMKRQINDLLDAEVRNAERCMKQAAIKTLATMAAVSHSEEWDKALNEAIAKVSALALSRGEA